MARKTNHDHHDSPTHAPAGADWETSEAESGGDAETAAMALEHPAEAGRDLSAAADEAQPTAGQTVLAAEAAAAESPASALPEPRGLLRRGVYFGVYYAAYGLVFGAMTVGQFIPRGSMVAEGLRNGANAARRDFEETLQSSETHGSTAAPAAG